MGYSRVIFEKKFSQLAEEDFDRIYERNKESLPAFTRKDSAERCREIFEQTVQVLIPERIEGRNCFIETARDLANFYEMDTTVVEYENRLVASFCGDWLGTYSGIKEIILLADDIGFQCDNGKITFNVIYYTHATYCSGRKISPPDSF